MGPFIQRPTTQLDELIELITIEAVNGGRRYANLFGHGGNWVGSTIYIQCRDCDFRTTGPAGRDYSNMRFRANTHSMQLMRHRAERAIAQGLWP